MGSRRTVAGRRIVLACVVLLSTAAGLEADAPRARARCNPDWTRVGQPKSTSVRGDDMDLTYLLKKARVRADPEELLTILESPSSRELRSQALFAIFDCSFRETRPELEEFLLDPDSEPLRELLVFYLLKWKSQKTKAFVRELVTNPSHGDRARLKWYPTHLEQGGDADLEFLARTVESSDSWTRFAAPKAVEALLGRPEYRLEGLALMRKLLRDPNTGLRSSAMRQLYEAADHLEATEICPLFEDIAQNDESRDLRVEAAGWLLHLGWQSGCPGVAP